MKVNVSQTTAWGECPQLKVGRLLHYFREKVMQNKQPPKAGIEMMRQNVWTHTMAPLIIGCENLGKLFNL
jgi:hypothetical protein